MKSISAIIILLFLYVQNANANDEITLFDGAGNPHAYIAVDDELTIYLWGGKPAAYLKKDDEGGFHVYGFNGKHLGWFVRNVIWDQQGYGSCATKDAISGSTKFEPFKSFKQFKPFKSFTEFAPFRPSFSSSFGDTPCKFLLGGGTQD